MRKFAIAYHTEDDEGDYWAPIDITKPLKDLKFKIKKFVFNNLDKSDNPKICKLINRHKFPKTNELFPTSQICSRCGEKVTLNMIIPDSILNGSEPYSLWKEYGRINEIPENWTIFKNSTLVKDLSSSGSLPIDHTEDIT